MEYETYQATNEMNNRGTFFFTDCGNRIYSVQNDYMAYHGKLCPACMAEGKFVTLYMMGTDEAKSIVEKRLVN